MSRGNTKVSITLNLGNEDLSKDNRRILELNRARKFTGGRGDRKSHYLMDVNKSIFLQVAIMRKNMQNVVKTLPCPHYQTPL